MHSQIRAGTHALRVYISRIRVFVSDCASPSVYTLCEAVCISVQVLLGDWKQASITEWLVWCIWGSCIFTQAAPQAMDSGAPGTVAKEMLMIVMQRVARYHQYMAQVTCIYRIPRCPCRRVCVWEAPLQSDAGGTTTPPGAHTHKGRNNKTKKIKMDKRYITLKTCVNFEPWRNFPPNPDTLQHSTACTRSVATAHISRTSSSVT